MIVVDTNVLSEPLAKSPSAKVIDFFERNASNLYMSAISIGELFHGARLLPAGKRRENLLLAISDIENNYSDKILPYNALAAKKYAELQEIARNKGRKLSVEDAMIAAICLANNAQLATRNTKDFDYLKIELLNPFL
jgi:predicted nucleic acid-binding protein